MRKGARRGKKEEKIRKGRGKGERETGEREKREVKGGGGERKGATLTHTNTI